MHAHTVVTTIRWSNVRVSVLFRSIKGSVHTIHSLIIQVENTKESTNKRNESKKHVDQMTGSDKG